ncbi:hypothetical protein B0H14DRAFT_3439959 [Mycena olivaceomarginata]|nr:hypothetical protein B0H14DRAFT_3439959 [Mycena olivaceomarginata]
MITTRRKTPQITSPSFAPWPSMRKLTSSDFPTSSSRTGDGRIVFPKLVLGERLALAMAGIGEIKRILLQLAEAVISLHSIGLIRRDVALRNILASSDKQTAYVPIRSRMLLWELGNLDLSAVPFYHARFE